MLVLRSQVLFVVRRSENFGVTVSTFVVRRRGI